MDVLESFVFGFDGVENGGKPFFVVGAGVDIAPLN